MSALDPAQQSTETIYDRLGGDAGVRRLVDVFCSSISEDSVLPPVFGSPVATHVDQWHW
jgi:truncated hemoglobin YjbI